MAERVVSRPTEGGGLQLASDGDLGRALLAHHPDASREVWQRYAPMVYNFFSRALGSDNEVEDMTQDVFLRLFQGQSALRDPESLRSYVFSIAVRMLKWQLRRRKVRRIVGFWKTGDMPESAPQAAVDDGSEARRVLSGFYKVLDQLSLEHRSAFVLRHLQGMSLEETAQAMGVSLATAKRKIKRATQEVDVLVAENENLAAYVQQHAQWRRGTT